MYSGFWSIYCLELSNEAENAYKVLTTTMKAKRASKALFTIAAIYEGLLGATFLVGGIALFQWLGITPPNHPGYVQFPAALLFVFGIMFANIAANPVRNRNLIPYGILLKVSYCGVVIFHWVASGIPWIWKPFCIADLVFLALFAWAWIELGKDALQGE